MPRIQSFAVLLTAASLITVCAPAIAHDNPDQIIVAKPGKTICASKEQKQGNTPIKAEVCVTQGNFSHDVYQLKIDGKTVLKGIDDETTKGIFSSHNGEKIQLTCIPKHEAPTEVSSEKVAEVQKLMPKLSKEEATQAVIRMDTVEVGRTCTASLGQDSLISVFISFE